MQGRPVPGGATNRPGAVRNPDLVGRDRELGALRDALSSVPAVVLVEGEAGVGKSRLVREFLARAGGGRTALVGVCPPLREPYTLAPLLDAVRGGVERVAGLPLSPLAGALRPLFPEWAEDLPPAPEPLEDARAARHRLFRALVELLGCLDVSVLVLEDAHWADEATVEFLLFLAHRQPPAVPGLVVTCRREDVPPDSLLPRLWSRPPTGGTLTRLPLAPLDVAATAALVSSMLDDDRVSDGFAEFLHERTDGIPLVVEESVRLLHDRADLVRRDGEWFRRHLDHIAVPPTVRDAVLERVGRLGPEAQAVLRAAAVLGDPVEPRVLLDVAGLRTTEAGAAGGPGRDPDRYRDRDPGADGLAEAVRCGLLQEDRRGAVSFRHVVAARAVYGAIPPGERREAHLRAGWVLERLDRQPAARLAYHFREAGETGSWCRHAEAAVEFALATGDEATAGALLHDVLTNAVVPPATMARLLKSLPLTSIAGEARLRDLVAAVRSVLACAPPGGADEGSLRSSLGSLLLVLEDVEQGRAELERAVPYLAPGSADAASAMALLAEYQGADRPVSAHLHWLRRADEAAAVASMSPAQRIGWVVARATTLLVLGEEEGWAEAARLPDTAATFNELGRIAHGQYNIGEMAMRWGRHAEARRRLTRALELSEEHEYLRLADLVRMALAHLDWFTGAWDGLPGRAAALAGDESLQPVARSEALLVLGLLDVATGAHDRAAAELHEVLATRRRHGTPDGHAEPAAALGALAQVGGRVEEALAVTEEPVGVIAGKGTWLWATHVLPVRTQALVAAGRVGDAAELVAAFARGLGRRDVPAARASLLSCRALVAEGRGEHVDAAALFARAARAFADLPQPYEALLARERQAHALLAAGDRTAALDLLAQVFRGLTDLGARAGAERVLRALRAHGVEVRRPPWMGGRRGYGNRLSPRELDVVRLVVTGRTNREIAAELSRSPKTVATQLNSAMRKLGVTSRTALAVKVTESGDAGLATGTGTGASAGHGDRTGGQAGGQAGDRAGGQAGDRAGGRPGGRPG